MRSARINYRVLVRARVKNPRNLGGDPRAWIFRRATYKRVFLSQCQATFDKVRHSCFTRHSNVLLPLPPSLSRFLFLTRLSGVASFANGFILTQRKGQYSVGADEFSGKTKGRTRLWEQGDSCRKFPLGQLSFSYCDWIFIQPNVHTNVSCFGNRDIRSRRRIFIWSPFSRTNPDSFSAYLCNNISHVQ